MARTAWEILFLVPALNVLKQKIWIWAQGGDGWHCPAQLGVALLFDYTKIVKPARRQKGIVIPRRETVPEPFNIIHNDYAQWDLQSFARRLGNAEYDRERKLFQFDLYTPGTPPKFDCLIRARLPETYLSAVMDGMPTAHWKTGSYYRQTVGRPPPDLDGSSTSGSRRSK